MAKSHSIVVLHKSNFCCIFWSFSIIANEVDTTVYLGSEPPVPWVKIFQDPFIHHDVVPMSTLFKYFFVQHKLQYFVVLVPELQSYDQTAGFLTPEEDVVGAKRPGQYQLSKNQEVWFT